MADLALIKKLRETTGCGIADCNKALKENKDNFDQSVDWLRKKGLSAAVKKGGRITSEGTVSILIEGQKAAILEINSETDFVARNDKFQSFVRNVTSASINANSNIETLKAANYPTGSNSVDEELKNQIGVIGENINIRRVANLTTQNCSKLR
jgi:elongation factor Ts